MQESKSPIARETTLPFCARFMAVSDREWRAIKSVPRLYREIKFHVSTLALCTASFGFAVANVAHGLLDYAWLAAICFGGVAAFGLYTIDKHFLVQARGAGDANRSGIRKVRFASMFIVGLSFVLLATDSFREDIDRVLAQEGGHVRSNLEQSDEYAPELQSAHASVDAADRAVSRASELVTEIARLKVKQSAEMEGVTNECEGNVVDGQVFHPICGPKARGHKAEADRLGREIDVDQAELRQLGDVSGKQTAARTALSQINNHIDADVARATQGASKKLDAIVGLVASNLSAALAVLFWIAVGMIPDALMFLAQGRAFNHETFAKARTVDEEVSEADLASARSDDRQQRTDALKPIDVKISIVPKPGGPQPSSAGDTKSETAAQGAAG
jgi:hypothetical protein